MTKEEKGTIRQEIIGLLESQPSTIREMSQAIGISEKDVYHHLTFIEKSLRPQKKRIHVQPYHCLACGFDFTTRQSFKKPGKCPACRHTRIAPAVFRIAP